MKMKNVLIKNAGINTRIYKIIINILYFINFEETICFTVDSILQFISDFSY